jgi:hypothetical protein
MNFNENPRGERRPYTRRSKRRSRRRPQQSAIGMSFAAAVNSSLVSHDRKQVRPLDFPARPIDSRHAIRRWAHEPTNGGSDRDYSTSARVHLDLGGSHNS